MIGGRGTVLGVRVDAVLETVAVVAIAILVDARFGAGNRFDSICPHPFWIPVLLASTYYGINEGLAAAAICSAVLLAGNMPEQRLNEDLSAWLLRSTLSPVLWFVAAVVLGEIRSWQRRVHSQVEDQLADTQAQARTIAAAYETLRRLNEQLEESIASQVQTFHTLYRASRTIERHATGDVLVGVIDLVISVLSPGKFSLFLLNGPILEAAESEGWEPGDPFSREFDSGSPLFKAIVEERQVLSVSDPAYERILQAEGVLAGPLVNPVNGHVIGMLKIETLGFLDLTPTSFQNFRIICEWIGNAFASAERVEQLEQSPYFDRLRCLMPAGFFDCQRAIMETLARCLGFNLSVAFVRVELSAPAGPEETILSAQHFSIAAEKALLPTDLRFDYRCGGWDYAVLMPGRTPEDADDAVLDVLGMLAVELSEAGIQARFRHTVEPVHRAFVLRG